MSLDVSILGPVTMTYDGQVIPIIDRRPRVFLGILAHDLGLIDKDKLIGYLWDRGEEPADPSDAVQTCAKGARAALDRVPGGRTLLKTTRNAGYQLLVKPQQVDKHRFTALKARAEAALPDDPGMAARLGRRALAQWPGGGGLRGGTPLESTDARLDPLTRPLQQQFRDVRLLCIDAELKCGRHRRLLAELDGLTAEEDGAIDAELVGLHMVALFRADRTPEAVATFERYENAMGELGGYDSVKELKDLRNRILNDDDELKLDESDYADYGSEEKSEEERTPAAGSSFSVTQHGNDARSYQAHSMIFHEGPDK
ncbi:hypothetical protein GCM10012284_11510 [Mangrovihabitans endophyticus]|uniref:Bacterial transcriptional activator domain-containing protein n=1 Tax=Mangrovihabitans endophyticus TaxID=1751298 RepID=A0A8J3FLT3_9ACTN|nr:hypothetical protein GCM10012284_11510 [Mangrovihabitans endophyticus]